MLVPPLPADVDWEGLSSLATAPSALHALLRNSSVVLDVPVSVMGQPPLLFAASMYDEDMAILILSQRQRLHVDVNAVDNHGFTALHYAADADAVDLVRALLQCADIDLHATSEDLSVLGHVESGGRTPLHLAVIRGNLAIVQMLVDHDPTVLVDLDWDENSAAHLAQLHGRSSIEQFLWTRCSNKAQWPSLSTVGLDELRRTQQTAAAARYTASLSVPPTLDRVHVLRNILTPDECNFVVHALTAHTDRVGWQTKRHTAYPTTDLPSYSLPHIDVWMQAKLRNRLFPAIQAAYGLPPTALLSFRDLFYVKYEKVEASATVQNSLGLHCDGSILSFNVLLNRRDAFVGGGTYFAATNSTVHIEQGDAAVHSGRVVHGAAPVEAGKRLILVAFLNVRQRRKKE
ncbi:hypothetical protein H310_04630 [Aphanomyces invadans]|uniref:Fe2OG dioxygenase domain-containing protein n=1 Tax=Aphanomyces invadans TaxID=157072 RepID=A0A024UDI0_9STRA|nr:hypothetical protein H310_04630 [Aphanomyces invadans]ETW04329.1 hypothetical protein H310_04630 [Aphanomyces invadans]|eukprot:XP_008867285.1 hypothetical protein H310_04630 [Aphanomyces invadans]